MHNKDVDLTQTISVLKSQRKSSKFNDNCYFGLWASVLLLLHDMLSTYSDQIYHIILKSLKEYQTYGP